MARHRHPGGRLDGWLGLALITLVISGMAYGVVDVVTAPPPERLPAVVPYRLPYAGPSAPTAAVPTPPPEPRR